MKFQLFQILKDTVIVLHSICQQIWKTQWWPQAWKRSVFIPIPKKGNAKECTNYHTIALISHSSKVMLQILQASLQQYVHCGNQMFKLGLENHRSQKASCHHPLDHQKSKRVPEKYLFLFYWLHQSLWMHRAQQMVENSSRDGNTRPPDLPPEKSICWSRSNSYSWTWNDRLVPIRKGKHKDCLLSPCLFNLYAEYIMWMPGWMKHKLESRLQGEISIISDVQMTPLLWQ